MTEKSAYRLNEFCQRYGVGKSKAYEMLASGEIVARKNGKLTVIDVTEAQRWFGSLPTYQPGVKSAA